jgi:hypothetical protein
MTTSTAMDPYQGFFAAVSSPRGKMCSAPDPTPVRNSPLFGNSQPHPRARTALSDPGASSRPPPRAGTPVWGEFTDGVTSPFARPLLTVVVHVVRDAKGYARDKMWPNRAIFHFLRFPFLFWFLSLRFRISNLNSNLVGYFYS